MHHEMLTLQTTLIELSDLGHQNKIESYKYKLVC